MYKSVVHIWRQNWRHCKIIHR